MRTLERIERGTHDTTAKEMWALSQGLQFPASGVTRIAELLLDPAAPQRAVSDPQVPKGRKKSHTAVPNKTLVPTKKR